MKNLLKKLYEVSETPFPPKNYLDNPDTLSYVKSLQRSDSRKKNYPDLPDEEIEFIVLFILQLVDTQIKLQGALLIEPCVRYIVRKILDEAEIDTGARSAITSVIDDWYANLEAAPKNVKKSYRRSPDYEDSPLLTFHIESYQNCLLEDKTYPLYASYAYDFHKRLRFMEECGLEFNTYLGYPRTARFLFKYCSEGIKRRTDLPPRIPGFVIKDFLFNYKASRMTLSDNIEETASAHEKRLHEIINRKNVHPRSRFRKLKPEVPTEPADAPAVDGHFPGGQAREAPPEFIYQGLEIEEPEGEEYLEYEANETVDFDYVKPAGEEDRTTTDRYPEVRNKHWLDQIHIRNFHFYWDAKYLNLFHYAILYHCMGVSLDKSAKLNTIITFLHLLIHTGIDSKSLLDTVTSADAIQDDSSVELISIKKQHYLLNPSPIKLKRIQGNKDCRPLALKVYIPIPDRIARLFLPDFHKSPHLFSYTNSANKIIRLEADDIIEFIKQVNKDFRRYGLNITLPAITRSFLPLYCHRYGLDPIIACHVSGKDHQRLYGSQMHYIHVPHKLLARHYLATFSKVDGAIRANLIHCVKKNFIKKGPEHTYGKDKFEKNDDDHFYGYGSPIIPTKTYVTNIVQKLKTAVQLETDFVRRHNLFTIYCFLALQFSTGLRPNKISRLAWKHYNARSGTVVINDKLSSHYNEERVVPVPSVIRKLLQTLKSGFASLDDYIARNLHISDQSDKAMALFFFVNEEGIIVDFSIKEMIRLLGEVGINYELPPNMPRHVLRDHLYHEGISNDMASVWMGHQHVGREVTSTVSSSIYSDVCRVCMPVIDEFVSELTFLGLEYVDGHA